MDVNQLKERYRSYILRPEVNVAALARESGLHRNTLLAAKNASWDPNCSTLAALQKVIDREEDDVPTS